MVFAHGFIDIVINKRVLNPTQINEITENRNVTEGYFDENLIVIRAGMSDTDANRTAKELEEKYKITYLKDFVFVSYFGYAIDECDWVKSYRLEKNVQIGGMKYKKSMPYLEFAGD